MQFSLVTLIRGHLNKLVNEKYLFNGISNKNEVVVKVPAGTQMLSMIAVNKISQINWKINFNNDVTSQPQINTNSL